MYICTHTITIVAIRITTNNDDDGYINHNNHCLLSLKKKMILTFDDITITYS